MAFGFGFALTAIAKAVGFTPSSLFTSGEQGVWYDPSDFSTMFQDAAGTTPVTEVEQPVGLILDKSKGLVLGPELVVQTNSTSAWNSTTTTPVVLEDGQIKIAFDGAGTAAFSYLKVPELSQNLKVGAIYRVSGKARVSPGGSVDIKVYSGGPFGSGSATITSTELVSFSYFVIPQSNDIYFYIYGMEQGETIWFADISVRELHGNHAAQSTATSRPVLSARVNLLTGTETLATQTVTTRATTQTLRFEGTGSITLSGTATGTYSAGSHSVTTTAGNLTLTVSGTVTKADLRATNMGVGLPAYQRVNTSTDYDTAGFPMYLRFDGVDDWLVTPSINFTGTDKMMVLAGVRKLSDAALGMLIELGTGVGINNTFNFGGPRTANAANYFYSSAGSLSAQAVTANSFQSPITSTLAGIGDIANDVTTLRINGAPSASSSADQGIGTYANAQIFIGRRGGISLPFNGHLYSLIVRGAQSTAQQIASAEAWVNQQTGAY